MQINIIFKNERLLDNKAKERIAAEAVTLEGREIGP